jgi:hypothetical protein
MIWPIWRGATEGRVLRFWERVLVGCVYAAVTQHATLDPDRWARFTLDQHIQMIGNEMNRATRLLNSGCRRRGRSRDGPSGRRPPGPRVDRADARGDRRGAPLKVGVRVTVPAGALRHRALACFGPSSPHVADTLVGRLGARRHGDGEPAEALPNGGARLHKP